MKIIVNGAKGVMGQHLIKLLESRFLDSEGVAYVDINANGENKYYTKLTDYAGKGDVIIDFSSHFATKDICDYAVSTGTPILIATSGHSAEEKAYIQETAKKVPVFTSGNMSTGIALLCDLTKKAVATMPDADVEIVETHHNRKVDAPSGTALMLAEAVKEIRPGSRIVCGREGFAPRKKEDIGIHSLRMGNAVGEHEVIISTPNQTVRLVHQAHDRALFAEGALVASKWLVTQPIGFYNMKDMLGAK